MGPAGPPLDHRRVRGVPLLRRQGQEHPLLDRPVLGHRLLHLLRSVSGFIWAALSSPGTCDTSFSSLNTNGPNKLECFYWQAFSAVCNEPSSLLQPLISFEGNGML